MAASKTRVDWSLLLLRLAVGGMAALQGFEALRHAHGAITLGHAAAWGLALGELVCGALVIIGLWTWLAAGLLALWVAWPLVVGWAHGAPPLGHPGELFHLLAILASAIGGGGKWAVDR